MSSGFGLLLAAIGFVAWVSVSFMGIPWDIGEAPNGPFPYSVQRYPSFPSPKTIEGCQERVSQHDDRRRVQLVQVPAMSAPFAWVLMSLGCGLRWTAWKRRFGTRAARRQRNLDMRRLGLCLILVAACFGAWIGISDLSEYYSVAGMRIQTETLARSELQARWTGLISAGTTALAAAAVFGLVGIALLGQVCLFRRRAATRAAER